MPDLLQQGTTTQIILYSYYVLSLLLLHLFIK